jgi:predicted nuclease of predicted toxin-antitoxin system
MIRFVVDAQLPPALARFLASLGYEAKHSLVPTRQRGNAVRTRQRPDFGLGWW